LSADFGLFSSRPSGVHIHSIDGSVFLDLGAIRVVRIGLGWIASIKVRALDLTPSQVQQLLNRQLFVDVHTQRYPLGEIRGTLVKFPSQRFEAMLNKGGKDLSELTMHPEMGLLTEDRLIDLLSGRHL
jgi:hypothetical protein